MTKETKISSSKGVSKPNSESEQLIKHSGGAHNNPMPTKSSPSYGPPTKK